MRQGRTHAPRNGLILLEPQQRIEPHKLSHPAASVAEFGRQHFRRTRIPAVTKNDKEGVARKYFATVLSIELPQRPADPRPARPFRRSLRKRVQRVGELACTKQVADFDYAGAEEEGV